MDAHRLMRKDIQTTGKPYDASVVYCVEDQDVAAKIKYALHSKGLNVFPNDNDTIRTDKALFDKTVYAVHQAKIVLVIVTKETLKADWMSVETYLALEESLREQLACVHLVFHGTQDDDTAEFKLRTKRLINEIFIDFNSSDWAEKLVARVQDKSKMQDLLPTENVAMALAFSYFIDYLRIILPTLKEALTSSYYYRAKKGRMSTKFFIIIPDSGKVPVVDGIHVDITIKVTEKSLIFEQYYGDKKSVYNPTVYSIDDGNDEPYYFVGDFPYVISTLSKMHDCGFASVDIGVQVALFCVMLSKLCEQLYKDNCQGRAVLIHYNDARTSFARTVLNAIKEDTFQTTMASTSQTTSLKRMVGTREGWQTKYFVTITSDHGCEIDRVCTVQVMHFLEEQNVRFSYGSAQLDAHELRDTLWIILILSETSVKDPLMHQEVHAALGTRMHTGQTKIFTIAVAQTDISEIPILTRLTTVLKQDEDYLNKMWEVMEADNLKIPELTCAGNMYQGLAYAFFINYLPIVLLGKTADGKGLKARFKDAMVKYNAGCKCVTMLFIIVPKSCTCPAPGTQFTQEKYLGQIEPVTVGLRKYSIQLYRLTLSNGEKVCYARKYASSTVTMNEMIHKYPMAGLTLEEIYTQSEQFARLSKEVMTNVKFKQQIGDLTDKCSIIYFDDTLSGKEGVITELDRQLQQYIQSGQYETM